MAHRHSFSEGLLVSEMDGTVFKFEILEPGTRDRIDVLVMALHHQSKGAKPPMPTIGLGWAVGQAGVKPNQKLCGIANELANLDKTCRRSCLLAIRRLQCEITTLHNVASFGRE